jgi:ribosomal protein S27AE
MPYKDESERIVKRKEYSRKYYEANKEKVKAKAAETKKRQRAAFADFKATLKCNRCGFNHPAALDFHHTDPTIK